MLDILGNVFGKSKKPSTTGHQAPSSNNQEVPNENEGYVFVPNGAGGTPYAQTTILTDELIRMGSGSSMVQQHNVNVYQATATSTAPAPGHPVYPSLDVTNGYNPNLPFSNAPGSSQHHAAHRNSLAAPSYSSATLRRNASPIDNVPFALTSGPNSSSSSGGSAGDEDGEVADTLARIHQFMSNPSLSEYNFKLENAILRESLLT